MDDLYSRYMYVFIQSFSRPIYRQAPVQVKVQVYYKSNPGQTQCAGPEAGTRIICKARDSLTFEPLTIEAV